MVSRVFLMNMDNYFPKESMDSLAVI